MQVSMIKILVLSVVLCTFSRTSYSAEAVVLGLGTFIANLMRPLRNSQATTKAKSHRILRTTPVFLLGSTVPFLLREGERAIEAHDVSPKRAYMGGIISAIIILGIPSVLPGTGMFFVGVFVATAIVCQDTIAFKKIGNFFSRIRGRIKENKSKFL